MKSVLTALFTLTCLSASLLTGCARQEIETRPALETVARAVTDPVVARVNQTQIFASDVDLFAQEQGLVDEGASLPKSDTEYRRILDELIDQRLLALNAESRGLNAERDAKIRLAAARERILGNILVERHLRDNVNEASIRRMYEEQAKLASRGDEVRARHILVAKKEDAEALMTQLEDGADFTALARETSIDDDTADRGGDLGYFTQDMINSQLSRPIFNASKGAPIGPIQTKFGWHVAEILDRRPASQPSFETLEPKIRNFMTFDAIQDLLTDLRGNAEVVLVEEDAAPITSELEIVETPTAAED